MHVMANRHVVRKVAHHLVNYLIMDVMQYQLVRILFFKLKKKASNPSFFPPQIVFVSLSVCLSVQLGYLTTWMVVLCAGANCLFYSAHWQTYVTGTLKFGTFDVTEAQFTIIIIHLISSIFGTSFWNNVVCGFYLFFSFVCFSLLRMSVLCLLSN